MADEKQLEILKRGVDVWNQWREDTDRELIEAYNLNSSGGSIKVYSLNIDFSGADLRGANLSGTNFSGADLRGANFSGADLRVADLSGANLSDADLRGTDLRGTDFSGVTLENIQHNDDTEWPEGFDPEVLNTA